MQLQSNERRSSASDSALQCWLTPRAAQSAGGNTWSDYWEAMEDWPRVFRIEARDYADRLRRRFPELIGARALDFGCGFGHAAKELSSYFRSVAVWDASGAVRSAAYQLLGEIENIEFLDLASESEPIGARFDVILAHSVLQYMSEEEIRSWLKRWGGMLAPGGRIILSDLVERGGGFAKELLGYLGFAIRNRFFISALGSGLREIGRYLSARNARPLTVISQHVFEQWTSESKMSVDWLDENLGHRRNRRAVVLRITES